MLKIEYEDTFEPVYDITVNETENFYANGILIHNCVEITLPTKPQQYYNDPEGWIALCTLSAVNWTKIKGPEHMSKIANNLIRFLDNLLSYQDYVVPAAKTHTMLFRPLGVGIINLAYWLAKNDLKYDNNALETVDEMSEMWSYYLIKASIDLAKERGPCEGFHMTKWSKGLMPIDRRVTKIDTLVPHKERMDWDKLREEVVTHGIRNATLMAIMPAETSAQLSNSTNGIEPPRGLVSEKVSKHGVLKQVVPDINRMKNKYDLLWDQKSPEGYLNLTNVIQKYVDQAISTNVSYNPEFSENNEISLKAMISDLLKFYSYGGKNLYYHNTYDGQALEEYKEEPELKLAEIEEEDCESCKL